MTGLYAKLLFLTLGVVLMTSGIHAQDILYMQGGGRLECLVSDTQGGKVKYKMWQNRRGPDYVVPKDRLLMLFYQDGRYLIFSTDAPDGMKSYEAVTGSDRLVLRDGNTITCKLERRTPESIIYFDSNQERKDINLSDIVLIFFSDGGHELTGSAEQAANVLLQLNTSPAPLAEPPSAPENEQKNNPLPESIPPANLTESAPDNEMTGKPAIEEQPDPAAEEFALAEEIELPAENTETVPPEATPLTETPAGEKAPDNSGYEISDIDMREYKAKALDRTRNLGQYFSIIADKSTNWQDANDAIDLAVALFVSEEASVEVSSTGSAEKKLYPIRQYLERLKLLKYERVDITWSDIAYVSDLKKGVDGNYYGIITFVQKFTGYRDGQPVYTDYTRKNIEVVLKGYTKQVGGQTRELWDVFLSDIGVVNTRRG
ncbi:MAG: hypothetical protein R3C61_10015 [Bacteroidia bacterium]